MNDIRDSIALKPHGGRGGAWGPGGGALLMDGLQVWSLDGCGLGEEVEREGGIWVISGTCCSCQ